MAKARTPRKRDIENYAHQGKERIGNPPVGLVTRETDQDAGRKTHVHDLRIDPQLSWAGKAEHTAFEVPTVSLHVHERIGTFCSACRPAKWGASGRRTAGKGRD